MLEKTMKNALCSVKVLVYVYFRGYLDCSNWNKQWWFVESPPQFWQYFWWKIFLWRIGNGMNLIISKLSDWNYKDYSQIFSFALNVGMVKCNFCVAHFICDACTWWLSDQGTNTHRSFLCECYIDSCYNVESASWSVHLFICLFSFQAFPHPSVQLCQNAVQSHSSEGNMKVQFHCSEMYCLVYL